MSVLTDRSGLSAKRGTTMRDARAWTAVLLGLGVVLLYTPALGRALYLHYDEVYFAIQAQAIAATGRDTNGRLLPFYFEATSGSWFQPAVVYFTALFLKVLPLSEAALRLPTVFIAAFDVVLIYLIARKIFERESWAIVTALSLTLTPAHVLFGRLALSYLYPVFFLLAWLWLLILFLDRPALSERSESKGQKPALLFAATTCLGLGFFTYIAAVAMMPLYLLMTATVLWFRFERPWKLIAIAVAGFVWPVAASIPFHLAYPAMLAQKVGTYGPSAGPVLDPLQQVSELLNYTNLSYRVSLFFSFFNPGYLFLSGAANLANGTRQAGVFLIPLALLIPIGMYQVLTRRRNAVTVLVLVGFITAPLAASLVAESGATDRELEVLPFGVLLATFGLERLWSAPFVLRPRTLTTPAAIAAAGVGLLYGGWTLVRRGHISRGTLLLIGLGAVAYAIGAATDRARTWRPIAAALVVFGAVQFAYFYRDYLVDYPKRSAGWYMNNRRDALRAVFRAQAARHAPKVFVSTSIQYAESYWRLYTFMYHREDLQTQMAYFDPAVTKIGDVPDGAIVLLAPTEAARADRTFAQQPALVPLETIADPDGSPAFLVLQKGPAGAKSDRPSSGSK